MRDDLLFEGDSLFVSKKLKQIDSNIGYKKENQIRLIKNLQDSNKEKNKEFIKNKRINAEFLKKKEKKLEEIRRRENSKNNIHKLNLFSTPYHLQFLPKICPFIHSIDNILIMDSQKAEKVGSKGFEYIWKQEKLLKLSNIKQEDIASNNIKEIKNKNMYNHHNQKNSDELDDIFDFNYNEKKKKCDEVIELRERLNRIINQNQKVKTKLNSHKTMALKFRVKKIYHPKYESIEKHKPIIVLYNKTRRIFPENLMQKSYYIENDNKPYNTINIEKDKRNRAISRDRRNNYFICSSVSLNDHLSNSVQNTNINNMSNINKKNNNNKKKDFKNKNKVNMKLSSFTFSDISVKKLNNINRKLNDTNKRKSKSTTNKRVLLINK